jgi:membrane protein
MSPSAFWDITKRAGQQFTAKNSFTMGAALAYYAVFSIAPLIIIAIAIAGLVYGESAAQGQIAGQIETAVGRTVAAAVQQTLDSASHAGHSTTASIIGIALLLFGASGMFGQLQTSLNAIWECPPKKGVSGIWGFIRGRLISLGTVLGIGFLLLASLAVSTGISAMSNYVAPGQTTVYQLVNQAVSFVVTGVLFAAIFRYFPDCPVDWQDVWIGAALTALLFLIGKYLIGLYLAHGSVASAYGAAGSLVIILVWVYYASQILLFGAHFTQVMATQRRDTPASLRRAGMSPT